MLQAVIFDFDGTIAPTSYRQEKWFKFYSDIHRKEWPFKDFEEFMVFYNHQCCLNGGVQNVYDKLELPCNMKDRNHPVWPAYLEFNKNNPTGLYEGMKDTIEQIWELGQLTKDPKRNRRLRLGINTTNSWGSICKDLKEQDVLKYFDSFVTEETLRQYQGAGDSEPLKKPAKVSLALILGLMGSEGSHVLHVGDTHNDLLASQKVIKLNPLKPETLITVGACYGYEGREKLEKGSETHEGEHVYFDYLIDTPSELVDLVKKYLE